MIFPVTFPSASATQGILLYRSKTAGVVGTRDCVAVAVDRVDSPTCVSRLRNSGSSSPLPSSSSSSSTPLPQIRQIPSPIDDLCAPRIAAAPGRSPPGRRAVHGLELLGSCCGVNPRSEIVRFGVVGSVRSRWIQWPASWLVPASWRGGDWGILEGGGIGVARLL